MLEGLDHPMLETDQQWSVYGFTFPNYLAALGPNAQTEVAQHASLDHAMRERVPQDAPFPDDGSPPQRG